MPQNTWSITAFTYVIYLRACSTAKEFMDEATRKAQPLAGHVFTVRNCGWTGVPSNAFTPDASMPGVTRVRRFGMVTELRPECEAEYRRVHSDGYPGVRSLLVKHGMRNMAIYLGEMRGRKYEFLTHEVSAHEEGESHYRYVVKGPLVLFNR